MTAAVQFAYEKMRRFRRDRAQVVWTAARLARDAADRRCEACRAAIAAAEEVEATRLEAALRGGASLGPRDLAALAAGRRHHAVGLGALQAELATAEASVIQARVEEDRARRQWKDAERRAEAATQILKASRDRERRRREAADERRIEEFADGRRRSW